MNDYDLKAIISYLLHQEPVKNETLPHKMSLTGKLFKSLFFRPIGPTTENFEPVLDSLIIDRGKYLSENVAQCKDCHTRRDMQSGTITGKPYSGGFVFHNADVPGQSFISPNLTPDKNTGYIYKWSEKEFINRFQMGGRMLKDSPMPWEAYTNINKKDLADIYAYLKSIEPVENETGPTMVK